MRVGRSKSLALALWLMVMVISGLTISAAIAQPLVQLGPRPYYLVNDMTDSDLKTTLQACSDNVPQKSNFSIGHRGAPLQFPEHTKESYEAAARMGAGIQECDVTFTQDKQLVCRHSQCDLHTTTNILAIPELAAKCTEGFTPAEFDPMTGERTQAASARCCTSDITVAEYKTLCGKMDASDPNATSVEAYLGGTADFRTDLYSSCGTVLTHAESIELFKEFGAKMTPELKSPSVQMPFMGDYTQEAYAQQLIDEYKAAGVAPEDVYAQSFNLNDVLYWIANEPAFGNQAVYLDGRYDNAATNGFPDPTNLSPNMAQIAAAGVQIIAPPMWALLTLDGNNKIVSSAYTAAVQAAGLDIITWTIERSQPAQFPGGLGWYYQTTEGAFERDGDYLMHTLDVLNKDVGILGIFSDWPATVTYYANCMGLQ